MVTDVPARAPVELGVEWPVEIMSTPSIGSRRHRLVGLLYGILDTVPLQRLEHYLSWCGANSVAGSSLADQVERTACAQTLYVLVMLSEWRCR